MHKAHESPDYVGYKLSEASHSQRDPTKEKVGIQVSHIPAPQVAQPSGQAEQEIPSTASSKPGEQELQEITTPEPLFVQLMQLGAAVSHYWQAVSQMQSLF